LGTQYGNRILALITYLYNYHFVASGRVNEFFQDIFAHHLSEGTIFNAQNTGFASLKFFEKVLKKNLMQADVAYTDETGVRRDKKNCYLHVFSTSYSTHLAVHQKRGCQAMDEIGILPYFKGTLTHDHFRPYFRYGFDHALCNAHHLRELQGVKDTTGHSWPGKMQQLLRKIKKDKESQQLCYHSVKTYKKEYDNILSLGYKEQQIRSPPSRPKEICLLDRLKHYKRQTLLFMTKDNVAFDNNQRDIRMMKVKMKVSGCFRSAKGADAFCRIRSYISTIKKNGMAVFQSLVDVFKGLSPNFLASIQFS
jgi:transposase